MTPLLDAQTLAAAGRLQLVARRLSERYLAGLHASRRQGMGVEFSQYRAYEPGDDLRRLDWKLAARSDRYYIRLADTQAQMALHLYVDASGSMRYAETVAGRELSKLAFAKYLAATLAYIGNRQGDAIGLSVIQHEGMFTLPPRDDKRQLARILAVLNNLAAKGDWAAADERLPLEQARKEFAVFITDLHERGDEIRRQVAQMVARRNEVLVIHVLGRRELTLDYGGAIVAEDAETRETLEIDTDRARPDYVRRYSAHLETVKRELLQLGASYYPALLDVSLDKVLPVWLRNYKQHATLEAVGR
jgi:uncharacterized protein (DUF58 family)